MPINIKAILLVLVLFLIIIDGIRTNYLNQFKPGFYFEKYNTDNRAYYEIKFQKNSHLLNDEDHQKIEYLKVHNNYKKDATSELLQIHPIGSNIYDVITTIINAGGKCHINMEQVLSYEYESNGEKFIGKKINYIKKDIQKITEPSDYFVCYYKELEFFGLFATSWRVVIEPKFNDLTKVDKISILSRIK